MHLRQRTARLLLGLGLLCGAAGAVSDGAEWSRFRGPNGTGTVDDKNVPVQWGDPSVLWKVAIPGQGNSSPVVWNDKVFLQTAPSGKERALLCLDARTGKTLWSKSAPGAAFRTLHKKNTLSSATPAVDAARVYVPFWDGKDVSRAPSATRASCSGRKTSAPS